VHENLLAPGGVAHPPGKKKPRTRYLRDTGTFVVQIVLLKRVEIGRCGLRPAFSNSP
jgi:hypothetical protein